MLVRAVDEILGTHNDSTPPSLLRPGVEVRLQRGRLHRRIQCRSETLPLSRQQHPDPMDPGTSSRHQHLTSGKDTRSARCAERRTPGAGGDLRETDRWQHRHRARGSTSPWPTRCLEGGFMPAPSSGSHVTRPIGLSASRRYVPQGAATSGRQRARALPKPRL
jgi:hypothetical protein